MVPYRGEPRGDVLRAPVRRRPHPRAFREPPGFRMIGSRRGGLTRFNAAHVGDSYRSVIALAAGWTAFGQTQEQERSNRSEPAPLADHYQHLFSPELAAVMSTTMPVAPAKPRTAAELIGQLDAAGIKRAVVLSTAYIFEQPSRRIDGTAEKLRLDNDWTSRQVAQFPDRLIGFCGLNPLKDYALDELARCANDPNLRRGLKLHFGNAVVDVH